MKTRSKKPTKASTSKQETPTTASPTANTLAPSVTEPPHVFVLPKDASSEARVLTLPDPATGNPNRYFVCPERGIHEFTKIGAPKKACKSWLLAPERTAGGQALDNPQEDDTEEHTPDGYVLEKPDMFVATPIDPLFILLPLLVDGEQGSYLTFADYAYDTERAGLAHLQHLLRQPAFVNLEKTLESRMAAVCDTLDMGDGEDRMYQLSIPKLLAQLEQKARKMVERGLPASMEEHFVKRALEVPVLSIKREESGVSLADEDATPGAESESTSAATSQLTEASAATSSTAATSIAPTPPEDDKPAVSDKVHHLLRLRTSLNFLLTSYLPSALRTTLQSSLTSSSSPIDFTPLDNHLTHLAGLKKQAQALRSLSDNISRKRSAEDDEEALEKAEAKRRKKEEEDFKKKNMSRGVQQLAKADTSGMKKLSSFFTKAPPKKKA